MTGPKSSDSGFTTHHVETITAGNVQLTLRSRQARVGQLVISLTELQFHLLRTLIEQHPQVVTRTTLIVAGWGSTGSDRTYMLECAIAALRDLLGEDVKIETIPGIGYRLI